MSTSTTETPSTSTDTTATEVAAPVFEKGSWQHTLQLSVQAEDKSKSAKELAGKRLWLGAREAVNEFLTEGGDPDALFNTAKSTGLSAVTASKIKKVAITARDHEDFDWETLAALPYGAGNGKISLGKADKMARDLADVPEVEAAEDDAVAEVIAAVSETAPKTSTTVEGMLQIALAKAGDVDEFVKVLIDVLSGPTGEHNEAACRSFIRAFVAENGGRIKAAKPEKPTVAQKNAEKRAAPVKTKPASTKAKPVSKSKGDPNEKALPPKQAVSEDMPDEVLDEANRAEDGLDWDAIDNEVEAEAAPVVTKPVKAKPVAKKATPIRKA